MKNESARTARIRKACAWLHQPQRMSLSRAYLCVFFRFQSRCGGVYIMTIKPQSNGINLIIICTEVYWLHEETIPVFTQASVLRSCHWSDTRWGLGSYICFVTDSNRLDIERIATLCESHSHERQTHTHIVANDGPDYVLFVPTHAFVMTWKCVFYYSLIDSFVMRSEYFLFSVSVVSGQPFFFFFSGYAESNWTITNRIFIVRLRFRHIINFVISKYQPKNTGNLEEEN